MPWWAAGAAVAGGALGFLGGERANEASADQARRAQEMNLYSLLSNQMFQERMSNTAYTRATADLHNAGLNPMLALRQPASSPTGSPAQGVAAPVLNSVAAGLQGMSAANEVARNTELVGAQKQLVEAQTKATLSSAGHLDASADNIRQEMLMFEERWKKLHAEQKLATLQGVVERGRFDYLSGDIKGMEPDWMKKFGAELDTLVSHAAELKAKAELYNLHLPRAINEAAAESSWWKRNISPYLPDILKGSSALSILK